MVVDEKRKEGKRGQKWGNGALKKSKKWRKLVASLTATKESKVQKSSPTSPHLRPPSASGVSTAGPVRA